MVLDGLCRVFLLDRRLSLRPGVAAPAGAALFLLCGCGIAAAPQPPSLHLPKPVHDLTAARSGPAVTLRWTTPKETTDRSSLTKPVPTRVCRHEPGAECTAVGTLSSQPGKPASFADVLPAALQTGPLRGVQYRVYALNAKGRDAGPSNPASAAAGAVPAMLQPLTATNTQQGVVLRWTPLPANPQTSIRLERTLVQPPKASHAARAGGPPPTAAPVTVLLQVPTGPGGADPGQVLDPGTQFGSTYRYTGYRLVQSATTHPPLVATSATTRAVEIARQDVFPPAAPGGLVAIPLSPAVNGGRPAVDLSWSPDTSADFAGYRVYRRAIHPTPGPELRIAPAPAGPPLLAPAFHDAAVAPGAEYSYRVTAVNAAGVEGPPSSAVSADLSSARLPAPGGETEAR
jgi:hypothetical protein